ncbi:hypothetical protein K8S17_01290 [bacterium]|nr:hypothetical protein [bacterium]
MSKSKPPQKHRVDLILISIIGLAVLVVSMRIELFERMFAVSRAHEQWQLDEIFVLLMVLGGCSVVYSFRRWRELSRALHEVRTLRGIIPICAKCKKIRDDDGYWGQVETYVRDHTEAEFSHGLCPECAAELYPEMYEPGADAGRVSERE